MKKSHTVSSNIPKLSLLLFSRTLIFFFKNIQSLQFRLQVCSLIQSFSNSRFTYLFLALYIIEFLKFLKFFEKSDLNRSLCVCVYGKWYRLRGVRVAISGLDGSQVRVRLRSEGAIRDLRVLRSNPSDTAI